MLLFDASHTSHTRAHTGIQRVVRALYAALPGRGPVTAVCFDPYLGGWRPLDAVEAETLADRTGRKTVTTRGARWSLEQKISGRIRRLAGRPARLPPAQWLICAELFSPRVGAQLPELSARVAGPRVAVFHDALGLKYPELTPPGTAARLPAYLRELLQFDGIAAVSADSAASLREYWRWLGEKDTPPVETIPLGLEEYHPSNNSSAAARARVLCVATIEGRKNHSALLEAAETLWREGVNFELELIGLARPDSARPALDKIATLRAAGRPLIYHGSVSEEKLHAAYARCTFTVYPSLGEGFGLPVLESLQHGKPCVGSARGALGEAARDGGVLALAAVDASSLAVAMRRLLTQPSELPPLTAAARRRVFRTWGDYVRDLTGWMDGLAQRR